MSIEVIKVVVSLVSFGIAASLCAVTETLKEFFDRSIFKDLNQEFWNPQISWRNKWKDGDITKGEKFFGSSTFLSLFTDGWHLCKFLFILFLIISIVSALSVLGVIFTAWYGYIVVSIIYSFVWFVGFEFTYRNLK